MTAGGIITHAHNSRMDALSEIMLRRLETSRNIDRQARLHKTRRNRGLIPKSNFGL